MRFLSVCSGIEAASVAWNPLGWHAAAFSEIEPFPCSVLAHHYPSVPNRGDMTKFQEWPNDAIDLLCGGTPCQAFSVAGLRKGLADPRGNLMLTYGAIAAEHRPRWLVWENVPGVLSSDGGRDFGTFLGMLGQLGYGFAYRILDAQHFGVPQRRRRVFVVGCLGDWRAAAAVLFERHSLSGHPAPRRETRQGLAPSLAASAGKRGGVQREDGDGGLIAGTLQANGKAAGSATQQDAEQGLLVARAFGGGANCQATEVATALHAHPGGSRLDFQTETFIAHSLRGEGFDASEDGTGRGTPLVPVHAFDARQADVLQYGPITGPMDTGIPGPAALIGAQVRRLTPEECEALQGFFRGYTAVAHRGKPAADGPRYKALGNSWAVPCARWIGERINAVEQITAPKELEAA